MATFELKYRTLCIGELRRKVPVEPDQSLGSSPWWRFVYSYDFREQSRIDSPKRVAPLVDFPDVDLVYTSNCLWPFFIIRLPGSGQGIEEKDEVELLRKFGRQCVSNPFELVWLGD